MFMRLFYSVEDESASIRRNLGINVTELPPDPILEHVLRLSQSVYAGKLLRNALYLSLLMQVVYFMQENVVFDTHYSNS
mgnify:FL=1